MHSPGDAFGVISAKADTINLTDQYDWLVTIHCSRCHATSAITRYSFVFFYILCFIYLLRQVSVYRVRLDSHLRWQQHLTASGGGRHQSQFPRLTTSKMPHVIASWAWHVTRQQRGGHRHRPPCRHASLNVPVNNAFWRHSPPMIKSVPGPPHDTLFPHNRTVMA